MPEKNFIERMLDNGFKRHISDIEKKKGRWDGEWNPTNGWMGTIVYHPYERFEKENKTIELSLERFGCTDIIFDGGKVVEQKVNEKHIIIKMNGEEIYRNDYGILPPKEIENKLIYA